MPSSGVSVFWRAGAAAAVVVSACGGAFAEPYVGPSFGTVEFRWRERSTPGYNGSYAIGPGSTPGVDFVPTPDPSEASVTAQDASVVLVLEAKVTNAAGVQGSAGRGLSEAYLNISTNQASGGAFARQIVSDIAPDVNPRANARISTRNLGFDPTTLVSHPVGTARSVVAPFRKFADHSGLTNSPGIGKVAPSSNTIESVRLGVVTELFDPNSPDASNPGAYDLVGLDAWVPVYIAIYTITDVSSPRDIVFTLAPPTTPAPVTDYGLRTWRGVPNPLNAGLDLWQLLPGFATPPTFTVHVVPGPGGAGALGLIGMIAMRRQRSRPL